jgi:hypothetical protein
MAILADHENLWEVNRQVPAISLGAWMVVITFLICRSSMRGLPDPWHSTRLGVLADLAVAGAVASALVGSIPRSSSGAQTCGPVLYEWRTSASGCGDTLAQLRLLTFSLAGAVVVLVVAIALLRSRSSMTAVRP